MTVLIDHFPVNLATGTREFGPMSIPDNVSVFTIRMARSTSLTPTFWPNAGTILDAQIVLSNDNFATIFSGGGFGNAKGGTIIGLTGQELVESSCTGTIPGALGSGWRAKALTTVQNGPLVSQLTIEVS